MSSGIFRVIEIFEYNRIYVFVKPDIPKFQGIYLSLDLSRTFSLFVTAGPYIGDNSRWIRTAYDFLLSERSTSFRHQLLRRKSLSTLAGRQKTSELKTQNSSRSGNDRQMVLSAYYSIKTRQYSNTNERSYFRIRPVSFCSILTVNFIPIHGRPDRRRYAGFECERTRTT